MRMAITNEFRHRISILAQTLHKIFNNKFHFNANNDSNKSINKNDYLIKLGFENDSVIIIFLISLRNSYVLYLDTHNKKITL